MKLTSWKIAGYAGMILAFATACNFSASGAQPTIDWGSMRSSPSPTSPDASGHPAAGATALPATPTIAATSEPTTSPPSLPRLASGTAIDILQIDMQDALTGWGVGGPRASGDYNRVFRTSDGGMTWREVTPPAVTSGEASTTAIGFFLNAQAGWVTYYAHQPSAVPVGPTVWKTADGGATWTGGNPLGTVDLSETYFVSHLVFADADNGWLLAHVGAGMNHDYVALYRTADGGANWSRIIDPAIDGGIQSCTKTGMAFADGRSGWLTGDCNGVRPGAFLFRTEDGGDNWEPVDLPAPEDRPDLFTDERYACRVRAPFLAHNLAYFGVMCTDMGVSGGAALAYLYRATDGGNFAFRAYPGGDPYTLDGTRIWALGKDIFRSENGGGDWTKISMVTWDGQFDLVGPTTGWAAVRKNGEYGLVRTDDGGGLWAQLSPVVAGG